MNTFYCRRHYIITFLILLILALHFSGCSCSRTAAVDVETTAGGTAASAAGDDGTTTPAATTAAPETTTTRPYYLVSGEGTGNTRYVRLCGEDSAIEWPETAASFLALGDNILLYWFDCDYSEGYDEEAVHFVLYSPRAGEALARADYDLTYMQSYPQVIDDVLFFIDNGTMYVLDENLNPTAEYSGLSPSYVYELAAGGSILYYTDWEEEQIYRAVLPDLTFERAFAQYRASSIYDICLDTGYLIAEVVDDDYLDYLVIADAATEQIVLMLPYGNYAGLSLNGFRAMSARYTLSEKTWQLDIYNIGAYTDSLTIGDVLDGAESSVSYGGSGNLLPIAGASLFFETCEDLDTFTHYYACYDAEGGYVSSFCCSDISLEYGCYGISYDYIYLEDLNSIIFTWSEDDGKWGLWFWLLDEDSEDAADFPEEMGDVTAGKSAVQAASGTPADEQGGLAALYARAEALSSTTGLDILVGKDVSLLSDGGYDVAAEDDYDALSAGLDMLEHILSRYPDGFFEQLRFANMYSVRIALAGSITSDGSVYLTSAGGYVTNGDNRIELVIDVNDSGMENAFYHEFSHIIDRYLAYLSMYEAESPYSEEVWLTYTPDGFSYCEDYTDYSSYYREYYTAEFDKYFLDSYSVINATEDRAQLMEDALGRKWSSAGSGIAQSDTLKSKYRYYCDCIRWGFDTTGWPEVTEWEEILY